MIELGRGTTGPLTLGPSRTQRRGVRIAPVTSSTSAAYATAILATAGLQSYWKLDEASGNALDSKGAVSGTPSGTVTQGTVDTPANVGTLTSYAFNDGVVDFGNVYDFAVTASFSVECWVKRTGASELNNGRIVTTENAARTDGWALGIDDAATVYAGLRRPNSDAQASSPAGAFGAWDHVAMTYDGATLIGYRNGVGGTGQAIGGLVTAAADTLRIGRQLAATRYIVGRVCHVAIYNVAVPAATLLAHYNAGK